MQKRLQNRVAESRMTLPVVAAYAVAVWVAAGLLTYQSWLSFVAMAVTTYLMVELNNQNALIRIYSRMVSCSFLVLSCAAMFLFPSWKAAVGCLCFVTFLLLLSRTYQDKQSPGGTFYAFCFLGFASLIHAHILYFLPLFWLFMAFKVLSLSWRTFFASLLGVLLPYWLALPYFIWQADFSLLAGHFMSLLQVEPFDYATLSVQQVVYFLFLVALCLTGTVHYLRSRYKDKIRTRLLYDCFVIMTWLCAVLLVLQPKHATLLLPMMVVSLSTLIGHFLALTSTRWTNIGFYVIMVLSLLITAFNLWIPSLHF